MTLANSPAESLVSRKVFRRGSLGAPRSLLFVLALTLFAVAADQFAAPILQTNSPLWATVACVLLVWRRGELSSSSNRTLIRLSVSKERLTIFFAAHLVLIMIVRSTASTLEPMAGTATIGGILLAVSKLFVLAPTMVVFPLFHWKQLVSEYSSEGIVALIILLNSVPRRALETLWPWYGQILGRFVYTMAHLLVSGLGYENDLNPTVTGPDMDIAILPACSGIHGLELLGYLFGIVAFLDWNRLRKGRALLVYFAGSFVMLLSNALRITSFIVLGNRGFIDFVSRFHQSAGWIFFSVIFLGYLSLTYSWMLKKGTVPKLAQEN